MDKHASWQPDNPERADKLAYYLLKSVNKAVRKYRLFNSGDRVLVAVSGGKDSMTLLDLLVRRQRIAREHYKVVAGLVRADSECGRQVPEHWLRGWCADHHVEMHTTDIAIADELATLESGTCFRCAWARRKALFQLADSLGCNTLAFGHHADDIVETTLMNLFFAGKVYRMEPKVRFFDGKLLVVRPLCLIEERRIKPFARANGWPITGNPCPMEEHSRRTLVKGILRQLEQESHQVKRCIYGGVERHLRELAEAKGVDETRHR